MQRFAIGAAVLVSREETHEWIEGTVLAYKADSDTYLIQLTGYVPARPDDPSWWTPSSLVRAG